MTRFPVASIGSPLASAYNPAQFLQQYLYGQQQTAQRNQQQQQQQANQRFQLLTDLIKQQQSGRDEARQANENRYLDILQTLGTTRNRVMDDLANYGQSQYDDAAQAHKQLESRNLADVYSRGFGGSPGSLAGARQSAQDVYDRQLNRIKDDIINRRVGTDIQLMGGNIPSFMERRTDAYPQQTTNIDQIASLLGQLGAGGGGGATAPIAPQMGLAELPQILAMLQQSAQPMTAFGRGGGSAGGGIGGGGGYRSLPTPDRPTAANPRPVPLDPMEQIRQQNIAQQQQQAARDNRVALSNAQIGRSSNVFAPSGMDRALLQSVANGYMEPVIGQILPTAPGAHPSIVGGPGNQGVDPGLQQLLAQLMANRGSGGSQQANQGSNLAYIAARNAAARARAEEAKRIGRLRRDYTMQQNALNRWLSLGQ